MLLITRKEQEKIFIKCPSGELIEITLTKIKSKTQAIIGINGPQDYRIERDDTKKTEENKLQ